MTDASMPDTKKAIEIFDEVELTDRQRQYAVLVLNGVKPLIAHKSVGYADNQTSLTLYNPDINLAFTRINASWLRGGMLTQANAAVTQALADPKAPYKDKLAAAKLVYAANGLLERRTAKHPDHPDHVPPAHSGLSEASSSELSDIRKSIAKLKRAVDADPADFTEVSPGDSAIFDL